MKNLYTKGGKTYEAYQVAKENEKTILELGPVEVYEDPYGDLVAQINTPSGAISVSAPGYVVKDPLGQLFGISLEELLADYVPVPLPEVP